MSYSCYISFKKIEFKDVYKFFQDYKKFAINNLDEIVKENFIWCPSIKERVGHIEYKDLSLLETDRDRNWFCRIFKHRFFYDYEFGLLCVYSCPKVARQLFDNTVYFQNSCDQDYDFKDWEGIKEFENIYNECMKLSEKEICEKWLSDGEDDLNEENFQYYRRAEAYDRIWSRYEWSLYNDDDILYISLFNLWDDYEYALKFTINCYKTYNDYMDDLEGI